MTKKIQKIYKFLKIISLSFNKIESSKKFWENVSFFLSFCHFIFFVTIHFQKNNIFTIYGNKKMTKK